MKTVYANLIGRFGNQLFIYAHTRDYCERNGYELITGPWDGEKVFDMPRTRRLHPNDCDEVKRGYFQDQKSITYSRAKVREWFKFNVGILQSWHDFESNALLAHRRVGDYPGTGFPVVSEQSYLNACRQFDLPVEQLRFMTEENPTFHPGFRKDCQYLPDFIRMMKCQTLLRGNSTFSWWAAALGTCRVFAPIIKGLPGGRTHDCLFVEGNWPACADFDFVTDLYLPEI
jgi:hypothetical protein